MCDNLNPYTIGVFHEAVPGGHARELVRQPHLRYTATPGGWLNRADDELNSLIGQCSTGPPVWRVEALREATAVWSMASDEKQRGVD